MNLNSNIPTGAIFCAIAGLFFAGGCASVPRMPSQPPVPAAPAAAYHTVEKGQTLWRISRLYGVDMRRLMSANGISDPARISLGQRLIIPGMPAVPGSITGGLDDGAVERLVGRPSGHVSWRTITVHHSATRYGNARVFDRSHRNRGMGGLFYHFLIGNGNGSGDGTIEVGWRWKQQREVNRPRDIQICLVGNFMKQQITARQYDALRRLIAVLRRRYAITAPVRRHCDVAKKATECPGRNFPYGRLLQDIRDGR